MTVRRAFRTLVSESLEDRRLMANFGTPWPDARSLSVSFPTDQAAIGAYRNAAREVLDQVTDRLEWQEAALRAFQTWAVQANINIGLVADRGDDFGAVGLTTNDPRFGEFRIGAFPQVGTLANALPYQQIAGTWSGDVLLNTHANFFLADPNATGQIQVPAPNEKGPAVELFSVLLHEAGNALGLADNSIEGAVMNGLYSGPNTRLKASDIAAIRQLYGPRRDVYETTTNNTRGQATAILNPPGYSGSEPISVNGSLNTSNDIDFYRVTPLRNFESVSIRLWASGISLLKAKLEVLDRFGNKLADVKADSVFQNNLQLNIGSLKDHSTLFIRVARNSDDVFGIGDYRLDLDYRPTSLQPSLLPVAHDADANDEEGNSVDYLSVDVLFDQFGLVDKEIGTNDTLVSAQPLSTTTGFLNRTRYELQSSLSSRTDRDLWSFQAPANPGPTLHIHVDPVTNSVVPLDVILLNQDGDRIASRLTKKADGGVSLVVQNPVANENYVLFVRATSGTGVTAANYVASINFATDPADQLRNVFSGSIAGSAQNVSKLTNYKTQLFRFDLSSQSISNDVGVQLNIFDARTGAVVGSLAASNGLAKTEYVWLGAGDYIIKVNRRTRLASAGAMVNFTLRADVISDDQGPLPINPTQASGPVFPDWDWESLPPTVTPPPIVDVVVPLPEDPWSVDLVLSPVDNFYASFLNGPS